MKIKEAIKLHKEKYKNKKCPNKKCIIHYLEELRK